MLNSNYGKVDKLLHRLALGNKVLAEVAFDVEHTLYSKKAEDSARGKHVFVMGLARAGTTILMRLASHNCADETAGQTHSIGGKAVYLLSRFNEKCE